MKQIYDFSGVQPPVITEKMLQKRAAEKQLQKQIAWLVCGSLVTLLCLFAGAVILFKKLPMLSLFIVIYLSAAISGVFILTLFLSEKWSVDL